MNKLANLPIWIALAMSFVSGAALATLVVGRLP